MRTILATLTLLAPLLLVAQPPVAPSPEAVTTNRGENAGNYNILNSFETGWRFRSVGGDLGRYRSNVNYGNGLRLLQSRFSMQSRDGKDPLMDELLISTTGLGNDPYQFATVRARRNRVYQYDLTWRQNDYFNPALTIADGQHLLDTSHRLQDHSLTLLPDSRVSFFFGYGRNVQSGPGLSTANLFGTTGDEFPLFADIRRRQDEFRFGGEVTLAGWHVNVARGWERYREDVPLRLPFAAPGNNTADRNELTSLAVTKPYRGTTPYWRVALFSPQDRALSMNGRFTHSDGSRLFVQDENNVGTARAGAFNRQILVFGDARRPVTTGHLNVAYELGPRLTVANHSSVHRIQMEGDNFYREVQNGTLRSNLLAFSSLGIRTFSNLTDVNWRVRPWLGVYTGYQAAQRRIRSVELEEDVFFRDRVAAEQSNTLHAGLLGLRLKPRRPLTVTLDTELGRANRPIYPTSERNYHALRARVQYRTRAFYAAAQARTNYNVNSVALAAYSARSRQYGVDFGWSGATRWSLDAGYAKLHLDTEGALAYFRDDTLVEGDRSLYVSNLHTGHLTFRVTVRRWADLSLGYHRVTDAGDGRAGIAGRRGATLPALLAVQAYPLTFESPLARLSLRLHPRLRWNVGYQHYRYGEELLPVQNYRAHTGYTSLSWAF